MSFGLRIDVRRALYFEKLSRKKLPGYVNQNNNGGSPANASHMVYKVQSTYPKFVTLTKGL